MGENGEADNSYSQAEHDNGSRKADLERRERLVEFYEDLLKEGRKSLEEAYASQKEREDRFAERVDHRATELADRAIRSERLRSRLAAAVIALNVALAGIYIGDATDVFGLSLRSAEPAVENVQVSEPFAAMADTTLLFDDCVQTVRRTYPDEFTGQPYTQDIEPLQPGPGLRHTISYAVEDGRVTVVCDETITSAGVTAQIVFRNAP